MRVDDFRGISISPVISKLFEMAILDRFSVYLTTSDHQFGFKKNLSCRHAIYCVRNVVEKLVKMVLRSVSAHLTSLRPLTA